MSNKMLSDSIVPPKLKSGDEIRVIAPSRSMGVISDENKAYAIDALEKLGLKVTFGKHVDECDIMYSSSVESRVSDLHEAFADPEVKAILTVLGGYNCNQMLDAIDYDLIKLNPKIFCGFSDITALGNAIFHKTGLITYSGPHFSSFAMQKGFEYSLEAFKRIFFSNDPLDILPSSEWSDDAWYIDQVNRTFHKTDGYRVIQPGSAGGRIIGGNLGTFQLLRGTPYMPSLDGAILFLKEVSASGADVFEFDRDLQSLTQAPDFNGVKALVIGRFESAFGMTKEKLRLILSKPALRDIPIITNVDFGHTTPIFTFPIGGEVEVVGNPDGNVSISIREH